MKKIFVLLIVFVFFIACNNNKNSKDQKSREKDDYGKMDNQKINDDENSGNTSWSGNEKSKFLKDCAASFDEGQEDIANKICPCVLGKIEKEFASYSEADSKGGEEAGKRLALQCKDEIVGNTGNTNNNTASNWPQNERVAFTSNCERTFMEGGNSRSLAQSYCSCMLNKMEILFPDIQDAARLTEEDLKSPAMEKMAKDCLGNN